MAYNRRGYGMTTYHAVGDPFLGGLIKGAGKLIGGAAKGLLTGGPLGAVTGAAGALLGGGGAAQQVSTHMLNIAQRPIGIGGSVAMPPFGFPKISGGLSLGAPVGPMTTGAVAGAVQPKGYRLNKSGYFLKSGQYVPPGSRWVRIRRTNPANGRALRKAISRTSQFNNLVKRSRKNLRALAKV